MNNYLLYEQDPDPAEVNSPVSLKIKKHYKDRKRLLERLEHDPDIQNQN